MYMCMKIIRAFVHVPQGNIFESGQDSNSQPRASQASNIHDCQLFWYFSVRVINIHVGLAAP